MYGSTDYRKISVSLIATVFNEENNIKDFLESYKKQAFLAKEFIIIDAYSTDLTFKIIQEFALKNKNLNIRFIQKKSNRSEARNFAVSLSKNDLLAFTDAGCLLDKFWLEELVKEFKRSDFEIVGGFFSGLVKNSFESAVTPYFLQLSKNVSEKNFFPTTRSLLITKNIWNKYGGLNEKLELSEDYQLMLRIKKSGSKIAFAKKALVYWYPPKNLKEFAKKIYSFAKSDVEAGIIRPKVILIFLRYFLFLFLLFFNKNLFYLFVFLYLIWSIKKNIHNCRKSWYYLPILQVSSDLIIMRATLFALKSFKSKAF